MSLDRYLKTWSTSFKKLAFPYELFDSIESMKKCVQFPEYDQFFSRLTGSADKETYNLCKNEFNRRISLPNNHSEKWFNFECYLKHYNISDVYPASLAMIKQFDVYLKNFQIYPLQFLGLPY